MTNEDSQAIFETTINKTNKYTKSLKTVIPIEAALFLKLKNGMTLSWQVVKDGEQYKMIVWHEDKDIKKKKKTIKKIIKKPIIGQMPT